MIIKRIFSPSFFRYGLPICLYIGAMYALSSIQPPSWFGNAPIPLDKIAHFVIYVGLGLLLFRAIFATGRRSAIQSVMLAYLCAVLLAVSEEAYQFFSPRDASVYDLVFDCLGASLGILFAYLLRSRKSTDTKH